MSGDKPKEWMKWLSLAEYWYNTNLHSAIQTTPFEVVYGQPPPIHVPYVSGDSLVAMVDRTLTAREQAIKLLKFHLKRAQDRMKYMANKKRSDKEYEEGSWVYLKLQPYRQVLVRQGKHHKLSAKYFGPFQVATRVGKVAYKLTLPATSAIHPVFHVSLLKQCQGTVT